MHEMIDKDHLLRDGLSSTYPYKIDHSLERQNDSAACLYVSIRYCMEVCEVAVNQNSRKRKLLAAHRFVFLSQFSVRIYFTTLEGQSVHLSMSTYSPFLSTVKSTDFFDGITEITNFVLNYLLMSF